MLHTEPDETAFRRKDHRIWWTMGTMPPKP